MSLKNITAASALALMVGAGFSLPASAGETIKYTYDARGRLVKVERTGTVNHGVTTQYTLDDADNREKVKTTGAPS